MVWWPQQRYALQRESKKLFVLRMVRDGKSLEKKKKTAAHNFSLMPIRVQIFKLIRLKGEEKSRRQKARNVVLIYGRASRVLNEKKEDKDLSRLMKDTCFSI